MSVRIAVVGVGHLGKIHARILSEHPEAHLLSVVDIDEDRAREIGKRYEVTYRTSLETLLETDQPEAVVVSVPTEDHFDVARTCLTQGCDVLIEKPMTRELKQARRLVELAQEYEALIQVGHVERFNPAVMRLNREIEKPKFIECDRLSPFQFRSADIDVILDVMIHDLDILRSLVPGEVDSVEGVGTPVITPFSDIVNARLRFQSGCIANVSSSRISLDDVRKLRVFTEDSYYSLDYKNQEVYRYRGSDLLDDISLSDIRAFREKGNGEETSTGELFEQFLDVEQLLSEEDQDQEPLALELDAFLRAVEEREQPLISGTDGVRVMELAHRIREDVRSQG